MAAEAETQNSLSSLLGRVPCEFSRYAFRTFASFPRREDVHEANIAGYVDEDMDALGYQWFGVASVMLPNNSPGRVPVATRAARCRVIDLIPHAREGVLRDTFL